MIGFNLVLPSTNVYKIRVNDDKERREVVNKLCEQWNDYCTSHWLSDNHEEPYCAENRVKRFLDGMAYFLLRSDTSGIITDYKEEMNRNREIPVSACPEFVNDMFYGFGQGDITQSQQEALSALDNYLDTVKPKKSKKQTPQEIKRQKRKAFENGRKVSYQYPVVDTEGYFVVDDRKIHIPDNYKQYSPKYLKDDVLFDMDHVIVAKVDGEMFFFDQNFDPIQI